MRGPSKGTNTRVQEVYVRQKGIYVTDKSPHGTRLTRDRHGHESAAPEGHEPRAQKIRNPTDHAVKYVI